MYKDVHLLTGHPWRFGILYLLAFYTVFSYTIPVMREFFTVNRIMYASAFFALCVAIMLNITTQIPFAGFILVLRWIDVAVNAIAAGLCVFLFIKPNYKMISYLLFFIEGGVTAHMGFVGIGTLFFLPQAALWFL